MKTRLLSVLALTTLSLGLMTSPSPALPPTKDQLTKVYKEGVALYDKKQWDAADAKFIQILRFEPRHSPSQKYRSAIRNKKKKEAMVPSLHKDLNKLIVDKVDFDEVTLEEAVEFVTQQTKQLSGGKTMLNVVLRPDKDTPDFADRKLTFTMNKVPLSAVLDMIGKAGKAKFHFDTYAVIGVPTADPKYAGVVFTKPPARGDSPILRAK